MRSFGPRYGATVGYIIILLSSTLSFCISGYDATFIGNLNVVPYYYVYFSLSPDLVGLNVAISSAGNIVSGLFAGPLADRFGRRVAQCVASLIFILAGLVQITATTEAQFVVGRFLVGVGLTIAQTASTAWVMEIAPPKKRGLFMGFTLASCTLSGVIASGLCIAVWDQTNEWAWRTGLMVEIVFPALCIIFTLCADESPRWLVHKGRHDEALEILIRLHGHGNADSPDALNEFEIIKSTLELEDAQENPWKGLVSPLPNLNRSILAVLSMIFYQITGSNTLVSFIPLVLSYAGISDVKTILIVFASLTGCLFFVISLAGMLSDKFGRKTLLLIGTAVMDVCLLALGILSHCFESTGNTAFGFGSIAVILFFQIASYCSWMVISYLYTSEILKFSQRAKGIALATSIGYAFSFLSLYTIPIALATITWRYYIINASWNIGIIIVIAIFFKETKGKSLEQIDVVFEGTSPIGRTASGEKNGEPLDGLRKKRDVSSVTSSAGGGE